MRATHIYYLATGSTMLAAPFTSQETPLKKRAPHLNFQVIPFKPISSIEIIGTPFKNLINHFKYLLAPRFSIMTMKTIESSLQNESLKEFDQIFHWNLMARCEIM